MHVLKRFSFGRSSDDSGLDDKLEAKSELVADHFDLVVSETGCLSPRWGRAWACGPAVQPVVW